MGLREDLKSLEERTWSDNPASQKEFAGLVLKHIGRLLLPYYGDKALIEDMRDLKKEGDIMSARFIPFVIGFKYFTYASIIYKLIEHFS